MMHFLRSIPFGGGEKSPETVQLLRRSQAMRASRRFGSIFERISQALRHGGNAKHLIEEVLSGAGGVSVRDKRVRTSLLRLVCQYDRAELLEYIFEHSPVFILMDEHLSVVKGKSCHLLEFCTLSKSSPKCLAYLVYREELSSVRRIPRAELDGLLKNYRHHFPKQFASYLCSFEQMIRHGGAFCLASDSPSCDRLRL